MSRTEGQKISRQKYESKAYDQILIKVRKGKREEYKQSADELGLGQMELFRLAVEEYIANHAGESFTKPDKPESLSVADKKLVETMNQLPESTRKIIGKLVEDVATQVKKGGGDND